MRPGSFTTATKIPRTAPRCAAGSTVEVMVTNVGMATAIGARVNKSAEHDSAVITATGQPAAIGTHLDRVYGALMRLSHPQAVSAVNLPPAQPAVTVPTDQHLPTRVPGHSRGRSWMPRQSAHPFPA